MTIIPLTDEILNSVKKYHNRPITPLKYYRTKKKWTQQELAWRTHLSVCIIGHYEQGTRPIPEDRKIIFAKALGCNVSDL